MNTNDLFTLKNMEFNGVKALADVAHEILSEKGIARNLPTERTVRYYLHENLLPIPEDKIGQTSVFSYRHLLILLLISQLKEQGLTHRTIKDVIELKGKTIEEMEKLWDEGAHVFTSKRDLERYREVAGHTDDNDVLVLRDAEAQGKYLENAPEKNDAQSYLESLLLNKPQRLLEADMDMSYSQPLFSAAAPPPPAAAPKPAEPPAESWKRYTIAPGVEIHIEKNYKPSRDERERSRIVEMIERILHFRSRK